MAYHKQGLMISIFKKMCHGHVIRCLAKPKSYRQPIQIYKLQGEICDRVMAKVAGVDGNEPYKRPK